MALLQEGSHSGVTLASAWVAVKAGLSAHVLSNFLVLGLPGGVMMAADACSFDVTTVMASILGMIIQLLPHLVVGGGILGMLMYGSQACLVRVSGCGIPNRWQCWRILICLHVHVSHACSDT